MGKYIKLYDAIMAMDEWFSEPITPTKILSDLPTIEVMEYPQVEGITPTLVSPEVSEGNDCMLTMFGECSYNETGCGSCAVAEKIRKALSVEVSEDCISREWLLRALNGYGKDWQEDCEIADVIRNAPSVVPTEKG